MKTNKTYTVKTRNWNGKKYVSRILNLSTIFGATCYESDNNDNKYLLKTGSKIKAWLIWAYFIILRGLSGGWTYIVRPGKQLNHEYKAIY